MLFSFIINFVTELGDQYFETVLRNLKEKGSLVLRFNTDYYFAKTVTLRVLDVLKQSNTVLKLN